MYNEIREHIKRHKTMYACAATAVGVATFTTLIMRGSHAKLDAGMDWPEKAPVDSLFIFGNSKSNIVTTFHKGVQGHPGFITRCIETGELFANQGDAARAFNIPEEFLSKHLNYGKELIENLHFERVGVLT